MRGVGVTKFVALFLVLGLLSGCAAFHTPDYVLPSRDGLQAGEEITVGKSENVYGIARKHNVPMREMIVLNNLKPPFILKEGQTLVLPLKEGENSPLPKAAPLTAIEAVPLDAPQSLPPPDKAKDDGTKSPVALLPLEKPKMLVATTVVAAATETPPPAKPVEKPVAKSMPTFAWPVQGPIVSGFGPKGDGLNNDGINIGAPKGASVTAAGSGIVVYAGNEMKGFGNLVLIRHEGGWVTAYAHLDRMMVTKDSVVASGDMIGTVGTSGGVPSPQLHFETRLNGKPVDPKGVIGEK